MEYQELLTAISTVGFPIVMCCMLFWQMTKQNELHKSEMDSVKEVISDLKIAIQQLVDKLE